MGNAKTVFRSAASATLAIALLTGIAASGVEEADEADEADEAETLPDYEQAREAVLRGRAIPLVQILHRVAPELGGEIVGIELEKEGSTLIYELKILEPGGRLTVVNVDAGSGEIIEGGRGDDAGADR